MHEWSDYGKWSTSPGNSHFDLHQSFDHLLCILESLKIIFGDYPLSFHYRLPSRSDTERGEKQATQD